MPGICGIVSKGPAADLAARVKLMASLLAHEEFHTPGVHVDEDLGVYVGWATHRGSFTDCLPVFNEKRDIALFLAGEDHADKSVFDRLKSRNHSFSASNASYLVHLYEEHGKDFLRDLNGWFHGLLIDRQRRTVLLFNDRFGMQRLYYHEQPDALYFSSEAKSILKVAPSCRQLDPRSLSEFFCCGCALENRTLFRNIHLMQGGSRWSFQANGAASKERYFDASTWENQTLLDTEFFEERLREMLKRILPRYFKSEQEVGISLTGGLDTRILMAYLNPAPQKYPCYTFGGMYRDSFDVQIARRVADVCRQTHEVISLDRRFLSGFADYAEKTVYVSDGGMDVSGAADLYVNRLARELAPVRVTGNYGSEVLRGVRFLKAAPVRTELFDPGFRPYNQAAVETYQSLEGGHSLSFTLFRDLPWHEYSRLSVEQSQLIPRSPFMDNELAALMYRARPEVRQNKELSLRLIRDGSEQLSRIRSDRGIKGQTTRSAAHLWYEFLFKAEYAYNYGMPQWLARVDHVLAPLHVERLFLGRHKFHHFRLWFRDELASYVRAVLLDPRTLRRPYLNRGFIEQMVNSHTQGLGNYTTEITLVLTVELLHRRLIEGI